MKTFLIALISLNLFSCSITTTEQKQEKKREDSLSQNAVTIAKDTTIIYTIEGLSAEGTEATVKYIGGKIKEGNVQIFGETGQTDIHYDFSETQIKVTEKGFAYNKPLEQVNSEADMKLKKEFNYLIDFDGKPVGNYDKDRIDVFAEFKKSVPFILK